MIQHENSVVLIDDDEIVHMSWKMSAKTSQKNLKAYKTIEEFRANETSIDKTSVIYIDSNLGNGVKGEIVAKQLYDHGFENLYLSTGYDAAQFGDVPWIKGIIGKEPPWLKM